jgi:hypothetical protein
MHPARTSPPSKRLASALLALALQLAGCRSTLEMSADELAHLGEGEGRIVGSVLLVIEPAAGEQPVRRAQGGPKAQDESYSLLVRRGLYMGEDGHSITVTPGAERVFAAKLPAADYEVFEVRQTFTRLRAEVGARFTVRAGRTTYVGRLVLLLPSRSRAGMPIGMRVEDREQRDRELLGPELQALVGELEQRLMTLPSPRR